MKPIARPESAISPFQRKAPFPGAREPDADYTRRKGKRKAKRKGKAKRKAGAPPSRSAAVASMMAGPFGRAVMGGAK